MSSPPTHTPKLLSFMFEFNSHLFKSCCPLKYLSKQQVPPNVTSKKAMLGEFVPMTGARYTTIKNAAWCHVLSV